MLPIVTQETLQMHYGNNKKKKKGKKYTMNNLLYISCLSMHIDFSTVSAFESHSHYIFSLCYIHVFV